VIVLGVVFEMRGHCQRTQGGCSDD